MFEYYDNILCIQGSWLTSQEIMSKPAYDALLNRNQMTRMRRGCINHPALVAFDSIPERFKKKIIALAGDPYASVKEKQFVDQIKPDAQAMTYFSSFKLMDGRNLPKDTITEYYNNAVILNALRVMMNNRTQLRKALGGRVSGAWEKMAEVVMNIDKSQYPHSLPTHQVRLKERYKKYVADGYQSLIHKGFCNDNSRKVTVDIERLILSLYILPNKPYSSSVHDLYLQFLGGAIDVVDCETGEMFDRADFVDEKGSLIELSEATIWNYINDPKNRVIVDKFRTGSLEFSSTHRPFHHRLSPEFAFSKISMDDRDLPRKMHDGTRVKAYYAYDVASGCVVGAAYSKLKDRSLFVDCMRDMFRFIDRHGLGMPLEVEVEHHLVNTFADDMMKAGNLFQFVRWCNPGNSQEKRAEHFNRTKKYGYEKAYQEGIGRFYSKLEANRPRVDKVFDEYNNTYKEKYYSIEQLIADDRETIEAYNNGLHRNQKKYKGMTRLQVMLKYLNPNLAKIERALLTRYIGDSTKTSITRSQGVSVRNEKYQLPSPETMSRLAPNNYNVEAYYLPSPNGDIAEVYLYQNGEYICKCDKLIRYQESAAEKTENDVFQYTEQSKYVSQFDSMVKAGRNELKKVQIIHNTTNYSAVEAEEVEVISSAPPEEDEFALLVSQSQDFYKDMAQRNL